MTNSFDICFSSTFISSLKKHWPNTDEIDLEKYIRGRACRAIKKLNAIGNIIELRKVILTIDDKNTETVSIEFDKPGKPYDIVYLQVPTKIVRLESYMQAWEANGDLTGTLKNLNESSQNPYYFKNLCHEFGHLQDTQDDNFGYTGEDKELHDYIEIIWNVFLEARLSKNNIAATSKQNNCETFQSNLKKIGVIPSKNDFDCLWEKRKYDYEEIKKWAKKYKQLRNGNRDNTNHF